MPADETRASGAVKLGDWWFPYDDAKCHRHFVGKAGLQIDHLERAMRYVKDWSLAVDGGAHVGSWTRLMASRFKQVVSYELAPDTYECLVRNVGGLPNVRAVHAAIGDKPGRVGVRDPKHTLGRSVGEGTDVPMLRLDDEDLPSLGFLKLDLEGYEYFGLRGAERTIRRFRPVILIEEKGHGERYGLEPKASTLFLRSLGYRRVLHMKPDDVFVPSKFFWIAAGVREFFSRLSRLRRSSSL